MRRALAAAVVLAACAAGAPPAWAGEVFIRTDTQLPTVGYRDAAGLPDVLQVARTDPSTVVITGPGVTVAAAATECRPVPGGAACSIPRLGTLGADLDLGGGDDVLRGGPTVGEVRVSGEDGNDDIEIGGFSLDGGPGNDTLRLTGTERYHFIQGGSGDDTLIAGPVEARLVGGPGADRLVSGPATDVLLAIAGDLDTIDCTAAAGRRDVIERDAADAAPGCVGAPIDAIARFRFRYVVFAGGYTRMRSLSFSEGVETPLITTAPFARCSGRGCAGVRFSTVPIRNGWRLGIERGGARIPGRSGRALRPGARLTLAIRYPVGGEVVLEKALIFRIRARGAPQRTKRCLLRYRGTRGFQRDPVPCD